MTQLFHSLGSERSWYPFSAQFCCCCCCCICFSPNMWQAQQASLFVAGSLQQTFCCKRQLKTFDQLLFRKIHTDEKSGDNRHFSVATSTVAKVVLIGIWCDKNDSPSRANRVKSGSDWISCHWKHRAASKRHLRDATSWYHSRKAQYPTDRLFELYIGFLQHVKKKCILSVVPYSGKKPCQKPIESGSKCL